MSDREMCMTRAEAAKRAAEVSGAAALVAGAFSPSYTKTGRAYRPGLQALVAIVLIAAWLLVG
jgi:hypothetical protein